ncbi:MULTISPECIES: NUDIX hydrolase [Streptomyces]|uniref:NUDIX hydrolase n=2 Tax=Streptomyces TaxID=1883 RepID=A0A1R1S9Q3_9ACTN|nr:NUDIX domain-containing protein [Streptomyces sparsogenes]OMI34942.1 NUDIX hydrolase [Streptomyces sparsogenes DSM 40356]
MSRFDRVLPAALLVVPGPGRTVTFVHQLKGPYAGSWLLPGGGIEPGEAVCDAARREAHEETGVLVDSCSLFAVYEFTGKWEQGDYHLLMFACLADRAYELPEGFTGHNVGEVRQGRIDDFPMHSTDLRILTDAGLASYDDEVIARALAEDGITMRAHRVASSVTCG